MISIEAFSFSATGGRLTAVGNRRETEIISSCKKLVNETCQRQLMSSLMMDTLNIASRELAQQPQTVWYNFDSHVIRI